MTFLFGAVFFAMVGYVGVLLGISFTLTQRLPGSPEPGEPPVFVIVAGCALVGGSVISLHMPTPGQMALLAIVCTSLAAIWCTDVRYGIVPDVFTLGPLALITGVAAVQHHWWLLGSAVLVFVPFAIAAIASRG